MRLGRKRSNRLVLVTALLALGLSLVFATAAAAEVRSGSVADAVDAELPGSLDAVALNASYDTATGTIAAVATTREAPGSSGEVGIALGFGTLQGSQCETPSASLAAIYLNPPVGLWSYAGAEGPAQVAVSGATASITATGPALIGQSFNCVEAVTVVVEGEEVVPVDVAGPILLVGAPPPSSPPPASPPASNPAPAPAPAAPTSPPPPPKANLTFPSKTVTLHRNAWKKVTVKITNTGNATAAKVGLKIGKAKGVAIKPKSGKLKLKSIAAGKSKVAGFKVRLTRKAKGSSKLTLTLSGAKGVKASGVLTLEVPKKRKKKEKGEEKEPPTPVNPPLAEKIFYAYESQPSESAKLIGYAFIDGEWAFHGVPAEGLPTCTSASSDGTKASGEGCVKYSYDPTSGEVKVGSVTGKLNPGGELEIDGETYSATSIAEAGTRLQVEQEYIGYVGLCGFITGCSTFHEHLILSSNGEFVLSRESLTTIGGSGPGETFVAAGSYPADQHGTYSIEKGAKIALTFADGSYQTKTFAIFLNKEGQPDATYTGILLGTEYFTFAHDE